MGDRDDADDEHLIDHLQGQHDRAGAILAAIFFAAPMLVLPQIGVGDDKAGMRVGSGTRRS